MFDDKKSVPYSKESGGDTLVKLSGLEENLTTTKGKISGITLKNKVVTLTQSVLGSDNAASVEGDGYTFVLKDAGRLKNTGSAVTFKGSSSHDTLIGGKGDESIYGNAGNDYLVGGDGEDIITDYQAGQDKIELISGSIDSYSVNGKDVIFTVGEGTLTVKNGKGKKITVTDAKGKTTTKKYTKTQNISSMWFAEENNFVTADNLSEITKNDLTPTTFEKISGGSVWEYREDKKILQQMGVYTRISDFLDENVKASLNVLGKQLNVDFRIENIRESVSADGTVTHDYSPTKTWNKYYIGDYLYSRDDFWKKVDEIITFRNILFHPVTL